MVFESTFSNYLLGFRIALTGQIFVGFLIHSLWRYANEDLKKQKARYPEMITPEFPINPPGKLSILYGLIETTVFMVLFMARRPEGIAVWLAFKAIMRWKASEEPDPRHISGSLIYMIGTAMNMFVAFLGALIAYGDFSFIMN